MYEAHDKLVSKVIFQIWSELKLVTISLQTQIGPLKICPLYSDSRYLHTVWMVDFETPVCKLYLSFISADAAQEKEKKVLLPTGVSKSTAHTVMATLSSVQSERHRSTLWVKCTVEIYCGVQVLRICSQLNSL
jgi:hypothetical protein